VNINVHAGKAQDRIVQSLFPGWSVHPECGVVYTGSNTDARRSNNIDTSCSEGSPISTNVHSSS